MPSAVRVVSRVRDQDDFAGALSDGQFLGYDLASDTFRLAAPPAAPVTSVAGRTGAVTLTAADVGLGAVENTALSTWPGSANLTTLGTVTAGTWSGTTLAVAKGGTGQTTQQAALDALAGAVTAGRVLRGDGTHVSLAALVAGDVPNLPASILTSGTLATTRLGSGAADATVFLRGDQTWAAPPAAPVASVSNADGTLAVSPTTGAVVASLNLASANTWAAAQVISSNAAAAFSVGPNGDTNPALRVVGNVASAATGLSVTGKAAGAGVTLAVLSSGTNEGLTVTPKGTGNLTLSSGGIQVSANGTASAPALNVNATAGVYLDTSYGLVVAVSNSPQVAFNAQLMELRSDGHLLWHDTASPVAGSRDAGLKRLAANVLQVSNGLGGGLGWLQSAGKARLTANATNATATMSNLADLSVSLAAGRKYTGRLVVVAKNSTGAEGLAFDFNGGTATMTNFSANLEGTPGGATVGVSTSTALATALTCTAVATADKVYAFAVSLVVNVAGTLIPRFAEVTHTSGTATAELGSYLHLEDSPN